MSKNENSKLPQRIVVIGLDGATFDLIRPWAEQGLLPNFQRIMNEGAWGPLRTVVPPLTGPAWISFMTGKNPGKHSIYDFVGRSSRSYTGTPINASHKAGDSLWKIISRAGKKVGVFMVPVTYPPEEVNGFMVTGMLTPAKATDYTYPPELASELKRAIPNLTMDPEGLAHPLGREHLLLDGLDKLTNTMVDATRYLINRYSPDFFMVVFKETDVAIHWLWRFMDSSHPWYVTNADERLRKGIFTVYQRMDNAVSDLLDLAGDDALVIIMSDHGAGPLDTYFHVNTWLIDQGFMKLKNDTRTLMKKMLYWLGITPIGLYKMMMTLRQGQQVAKTLKYRKNTAISLLKTLFLSFDNVDWSQTQAYSLGNYGQIYINLKGREPFGIVSPGAEYEKIIKSIMDRLSSLRDSKTGKQISGRIYRREEIYHGPFLEEAPDLVFMPDDLRINGFGLYQFSSNTWLEHTFDRSGGHRMDGILMLYGPGVRQGTFLSDAHITDLAPTILATMGIPVPNDMDGKVLSPAFRDDFFKKRPIHYIEALPVSNRDRLEFSLEEEEDIKERLRELGYMA